MNVFPVYPDPGPCSITGDSTPPPLDILPNTQLSPLNTPPHLPTDTGNDNFSDFWAIVLKQLHCCLQEDLLQASFSIY